MLAKFIGVAALGDGRVVFSPAMADGVGLFDPRDDTFSLVDISGFMDGVTSQKFSGANLVGDGRVVLPLFAPKTSAFFPPLREPTGAIAAMREWQSWGSTWTECASSHRLERCIIETITFERRFGKRPTTETPKRQPPCFTPLRHHFISRQNQGTFCRPSRVRPAEA